MACFYNYDHLTHKCQMWDKDSPVNPEGADKNGYCTADCDEDPSWCQTYEPDAEEDVCDYCGEPVGFCSMTCESQDEDFEE